MSELVIQKPGPVSVRDNTLFLRPKAEEPDTNVTVQTNKHIYPLYLISTTKQPTYILRFNYPKPPSATVMTEKPFPCTDGGIINGHYQLKGTNQFSLSGMG